MDKVHVNYKKNEKTNENNENYEIDDNNKEKEENKNEEKKDDKKEDDIVEPDLKLLEHQDDIKIEGINNENGNCGKY